MKKIIQPRKLAKKKMSYRKKITLWICGIILVGGLVTLGYMLYRAHSSLNSITGESNNILDVAKTLLPGKEKTLKQDNGRTNIVLLGMRGENDPNGGLLADSIIVVSIQQDTKKIAMISIPRDLRVQVPNYKGYQKLNAAHSLGAEQSPPQGIQYTMQVLEKITGMPMHYGVSIDFIAFKEIIDALGGITVNAASDFYDPNYEGGIRVKQGLNDLNSDRALKYVWARLSTNDFDRSRRQREVISAIKDKAEKTGAINNPVFLVNLLNTLGNNVKTTMTIDEIKAGVNLIQQFDLNAIIQKGYDTSEQGPFTSQNDPVIGYVIVPRTGDFVEFQQDIQQIFNDTSSVNGQ
jgi:LCP family protein required for cell wall assembly